MKAATKFSVTNQFGTAPPSNCNSRAGSLIRILLPYFTARIMTLFEVWLCTHADGGVRRSLFRILFMKLFEPVVNTIYSKGLRIIFLRIFEDFE